MPVMAARGVALVTGASRRIGRSLALALARAGYDVAAHHRAPCDEADSLTAEIEALGRRTAAVTAELMQEGETSALVTQARDALGPLSLLVNNASLFEDDRMGRLDRAGWEAHMDANLRAPVVLSQAFAAQLAPELADGEAMILNIVDQRVLKPNPQFFSYTLSKTALWTATRMMAQALAPRIRVNAVGPGPTLASIHQDADAFRAEAAATPLGRGGALQDISDAVLYLAGARAVTGQMIAVDGGQHLAWRTPDILDD